MNFDRKAIKANARAALSAHYWPVVGILFLASVIGSLLAVIGTYKIVRGLVITLTYGIPYMHQFGSAEILTIVGAIIAIIMDAGIAFFAYHVYRGDEPELGDIFVAFDGKRFLHVLGGELYMSLLIYLWSLLLFIPGIIKAYSYSMTAYILVDLPEVSATEAVTLSKKMTYGYKWDLFVLDLSFIGWELLAACTAYILDIFYVVPYMTLAKAGAYDFLKRVNNIDPAPMDIPPVFYQDPNQVFEQTPVQNPETNNDNMFQE